MSCHALYYSCSCATVHDGMNMTDCAAYGMHQPHPSDDSTGEPEYQEVKTSQ